MSSFAFGLENDEYFEDDRDFTENDEFGDWRRRRGGRPPAIRPGQTGKWPTPIAPRPNNNQYVTQTQFEVGLARVGKQVEANSDAIKKVAAQANTITTELGVATARLDKQVSESRKEIKKQSETMLLMTLLAKPPAITTTTETLTVQDPANANRNKDVTVVSKVEQGKSDSLLPLVLLSGNGGFGGDSSNMLILALAFSGRV